jgi:site-specific DNA-methyltransferase (adenine-specific)
LFSFAGDTVLDPFTGTGTTNLAALRAGRNSIGCDIEPEYLSIAAERLKTEAKKPRVSGAIKATVEFRGC